MVSMRDRLRKLLDTGTYNGIDFVQVVGADERILPVTQNAVETNMRLAHSDPGH